MSESKSPRDFALRLTTYPQLEQHARAFAEGHLNLLLVCGPAGVGKSQCVRAAVGDQVGWLAGNVTAFGLYRELYAYRDLPIVLDDVDDIYKERDAIRLLKALCQTEAVKQVSWLTATPHLEREGIPRQFTTTSHVALITNQWKTLDAHVAALEDRGHLIDFAPGALDVHAKVAEWFWDQEVFDFVGHHLHLMKLPSMRTYRLAWEKKQAGLDWKGFVLSRCLTGSALEVAKLLADPTLSKRERVQRFVQEGYGCRSAYFHHARELQPPGAVPTMTLAQTGPPPPPSEPSSVMDLLRHRFGDLGHG